MIDHPEDADWVKTSMEALGLRHQGYEVTDVICDMWIDTLVEILRELSGKDWGERLERVWREQLGVICCFACRARFGGPAGCPSELSRPRPTRELPHARGR